MKYLKLLLVVGILVLPVTGCIDVREDEPVVQTRFQDFPSSRLIEKNELLNLHNAERKHHRCGELKMNSKLNEIAQKHAEWMARRRNLTHQGFQQRVRGPWSTTGENIAAGQESEKEVVNDWMNSAGHRANILNNSFDEVGFGVAYTTNGSLYWCVCFGGGAQ